MNKRLVGGMILLNLCAISLSVNGGEVDITNEDVKSQLVELRNFIDEKRDFTKGAKDLKPVLVQYRSSESKIDGVVQCNMGFNTDALHLSIGGTAVLSNGDKLTININVEYQYTEYVGYTIKTAKLNVISNNSNIANIKRTSGVFKIDEIDSFNNNSHVTIHASNDDTTAYKEFAIGYVNIGETNIEIVHTPLQCLKQNFSTEGDNLLVKIVINKSTKEITFKDQFDTSLTLDVDMMFDIYTF